MSHLRRVEGGTAIRERRVPRPTLLVVDDERSVRETLSRLLERRAEVFVAGDGLAALRVLASQPVDLVLTDIQMPGMDGLELLARVRAEHPHVRRVLFSGRVMPALDRHVSDGLVERFVEKRDAYREIRELLESPLSE